MICEKKGNIYSERFIQKSESLRERARERREREKERKKKREREIWRAWKGNNPKKKGIGTQVLR